MRVAGEPLAASGFGPQKGALPHRAEPAKGFPAGRRLRQRIGGGNHHSVRAGTDGPSGIDCWAAQCLLNGKRMACARTVCAYAISRLSGW